jgi:hypothetical protein
MNEQVKSERLEFANEQKLIRKTETRLRLDSLALYRKCSAISGAGEGNRTLVWLIDEQGFSTKPSMISFKFLFLEISLDPHVT